MRAFALIDGGKRRSTPCAVLYYLESREEFRTRICADVDPSCMPMTLEGYARKGKLDLDHKESMLWISERIVPKNRQNLGQVLKAHGLEYYDPFVLLVTHAGRCCNDDFYLREIEVTVVERWVGKDGRLYGHPVAAETDSLARRVGALLAEERARQGVSQNELAYRTGVQQAVISRTEGGRANPTVELLEDIASGLGKRIVVTLEDGEPFRD